MKNKRFAPGVKVSKRNEVAYRKSLLSLVTAIERDVETIIYPILRVYEKDYATDSYATELTKGFERLEMFYRNVGVTAKKVSSEFVSGTNNVNKERFYKAMNKAIGVDISSIIQNEGLEDKLVAATTRNVSLIKSIPAEHFKKLEVMVLNGVTEGSKPGGIIRQIQELTGVTEKRAKLIARDQSSKINSELTMQRQLNLGVDQYRWQTSLDDRVRPTHRANNNKIFNWDDPPKTTGHPGHDINCRCIAQPIINFKTIKGVAA